MKNGTQIDTSLLDKLTQEKAEIDARLANERKAADAAAARLTKLQGEIARASVATDAHETAKLPELAAQQLAAQNQVKALGDAIAADEDAARELQKRINALADEHDRALVAAEAAMLVQTFVKVVASHMEVIDAAEKRIVERGNHPSTLNSNGIAPLRQVWNTYRRRLAM